MAGDRELAQYLNDSSEKDRREHEVLKAVVEAVSDSAELTLVRMLPSDDDYEIAVRMVLMRLTLTIARHRRPKR
jgi:hypothetical protein